MVAPTIIATTYAPVAAPARAAEVLLDDPGEQHARHPDTEADQHAAADQRATATGTPRTALPSATSPTAPPSAGLRPNRRPEDRPDEGAERHHQHRAGLHEPGGARVDAEVGADRLQQRRVGRQRGAEVDREREHAEQHDRRAHAPVRRRLRASGRHRRRAHAPTFARRAAVGWS